MYFYTISDYVDNSFVRSSDLKNITQDGVYRYLRELNNTANKKEHDSVKGKHELMAMRTIRRKGKLTEGTTLLFIIINCLFYELFS